MDPTEIQMCVADCLLDDDVESLELIMQALNDEDEAGWRVARGQEFTVDEVRAALLALAAAGQVTPCAEQAPDFRLQPVPGREIGVKIPWESLWFHLEPKGRKMFTQWWENQGRHQYPRP